ncbi:MAG: M24 family metallopeptidase [Candidatus Altiarchaeota archaeon]|nr:M24 family metallopeptidase [Candidatus Altiarchaeota archaeon]
MLIIFNSPDTLDKNFYHLTGIEEPCAGVLVFDDRPIVLASSLESSIAEKYVETVELKSSEHLWSELAQRIKGELELNFPGLSSDKLVKLEKLGKVKDISIKLKQNRMIKTRKEQLKLTKAAKIANRVGKRLPDMIQPGKTENEVAAELEFLARKLGASGVSFPTIVASGPNSASIHHRAGNRIIQAGDSVIVDFGPVYKLYTADVTRSFVIGGNTKLEQDYQKLQAVFETVVDKLEHKVKLSELSELTTELSMPHSLGHGIGLDVHEAPQISGKSELSLETGMAFTIEPGIYGKTGMRIEDNFIMGKQVKKLTKISKELVI